MQAKHAISVAIQDATHGSSCDSERAQGRRHAHLDRLLSAIIPSKEHKRKCHAVDEGMLEQARQLWKTSITDVLQTAIFSREPGHLGAAIRSAARGTAELNFAHRIEGCAVREGLIKEAKGLAGSLKLERGIEKAVLNAPITAFDVGHFHETGEKRSSILAQATQTYITQGESEGTRWTRV